MHSPAFLDGARLLRDGDPGVLGGIGLVNYEQLVSA